MKINFEEIKNGKSIKELLDFSIINLDKSSGPTSFSVSQFVKKSLGLKKTAHFGTLDPQVSGVLPIGLNRACRLNEYIMHRNKEYIGIMRLHKEIDEKSLKNAIEKFIGKISQLPPVKSRVKRATREREVVFFNILEKEGKDVLFETEVQAGTYIRKLCDDIGKEIGGAHMLELRRKRAGFFSEIDSSFVNLYDFEKAVDDYRRGNEKLIRDLLIPGEIVSSMLPVLKIKKEFVKKALVGSPIFLSFIEKNQNLSSLKKGDKLSVFCENKFVGCYNFVGEGEMLAKPEFVLN